MSEENATQTISDASAELDRLQKRVVELETELGYTSWNVGDFYCMPTVDSAPAVVGQVLTIAGSGRPFQVVEAAEPALMESVPQVRELKSGLPANAANCAKPSWWPL